VREGATTFNYNRRDTNTSLEEDVGKVNYKRRDRP